MQQAAANIIDAHIFVILTGFLFWLKKKNKIFLNKIFQTLSQQHSIEGRTDGLLAFVNHLFAAFLNRNRGLNNKTKISFK